ncbi:hypothetical protein [Pseudomonas fluorescens]|uniref:Uncharacterized protein n=1 Tax=Pseudomonas fluorescens TaxID=294 RepID=A0A5E7MZ17_PSEFL|nr:hypothetical protein [Pseudomonas fluorescens]VVP30095.1 hypothetical protein PS880_04292 [Pseudomonas fluorescens]
MVAMNQPEYPPRNESAAIATINKFTKITGWKQREEVQELGDISGMVAEPVIRTILGGRSATVSGWFNEVSGNGYEVAEITLHSWELS